MLPSVWRGNTLLQATPDFVSACFKGPEMSISVKCSECQKRYKVRVDKAGRTFACIVCRAPIRVPKAGTISESAADTAHVASRHKATSKESRADGGGARGSTILKAGTAIASITLIVVAAFFFVQGFLNDQESNVETTNSELRPHDITQSPVSAAQSSAAVPTPPDVSSGPATGGKEAMTETPTWTAWPQTPPPEAEIATLDEMTHDVFLERLESSSPTANYGPKQFINRDTGRTYKEYGSAYEDAVTGFHASRRVRTPYENREAFDVISGGRYHGGFRSGSPSGLWARRDASGVLRVRGHYDGKRNGYFVVCDEDGRTVWEGVYEDGTLLRGRCPDMSGPRFEEALVLSGHSGPLADIAFSPNEAMLATASYAPSYSNVSNTRLESEESMVPILTMYDLSSGACKVIAIDEYTMKSSDVEGYKTGFEVVFSPDGKALVAHFSRDALYQNEHRLLAWNLLTGTKVIDTRILPPGSPRKPATGISPYRSLFSATPAHIAMSPQGEHLAAVTMTENNFGVPVVWNLDSGEELFRIPDLQDCQAVAFIRGGSEVLVGRRDGLDIRDAETGESRGMIQAFDVPSYRSKYDEEPVFVHFPEIAILSGKDVVVSREGNGTIRQWNLKARKESILNDDADSDGLIAFGVLPDVEAYIDVVQGTSRLTRNYVTVRVWDFETEEHVYEQKVSAAGFSVSEDGSFFSAISDGGLELRRTSTGEAVRRIPDVEPRVALSRNGQVVVGVRRLEGEPALVVGDIDGGRQVLYRSFGSLIVGDYPSRGKEINVGGAIVVKHKRVSGSNPAMMFDNIEVSPSGKFVAAVDWQYCVRVWKIGNVGE